MAQSGHSDCTRFCPLSERSGHRGIFARFGYVANDPSLRDSLAEAVGQSILLSEHFHTTKTQGGHDGSSCKPDWRKSVATSSNSQRSSLCL